MAAPLLHKRFEMVSLVVYATKLPPAPQVFGRIIAAIKDGECSLGRLAELNKSMAPDARNKRPFMDYLSNFRFDLDVHHPALRRAALQ